LIYLIICDIDADDDDEDINFILGHTFLQRFFFVFDTPNSRVGFATTKFTTDIANY